MTHCTNCNYKWKAKEVLMLGFSKNGKDCPNCGKKQYISLKTQKLLTLGYISFIFIPFLLFRIKLSDEEENLFE